MTTKYMMTASAAALALLISGCSQASDDDNGTSPTPTPTVSASVDSSVSASPVASESGSGESGGFEPVTTKPGPDASVDAAFETFERLVAVRDKQMHAKDTSTEDLAKFAVGDALVATLNSLKEEKSSKGKAIGNVSVEQISGYSTSVTEAKKELKDHYVYLEVCNDTSDTDFTDSNGKKIEKPKLLRAVVDVQAKYDTELKHWVVGKMDFKDGGVPC